MKINCTIKEEVEVRFTSVHLTNRLGREEYYSECVFARTDIAFVSVMLGKKFAGNVFFYTDYKSLFSSVPEVKIDAADIKEIIKKAEQLFFGEEKYQKYIEEHRIFLGEMKKKYDAKYFVAAREK